MQNPQENDNIIIITEDCTEQDYRIICRGLIEYNNRASNGMIDMPCDEDIRLALKDKDGNILGGISGHIAIYCFLIEEIWVDEKVKKCGHGRALLEKAEKIAQQKGCLFSQTNTFSFQSPGFYEKCGYEEIAVVDDFPGGIKHHYFKKVF